MWRLVLPVACACACNQVFGIENTSPPDTDRDTVADNEDNCPLVANTDQRDRDADRVGDACDPCPAGAQSGIDADSDGIDDGCDACPRGSNLDEDADGALDGCDLCPGTADDGTDDDGDGVGNACDRAPGVKNTRLSFDGFAPPASTWITGFMEWTTTDIGFGPVPTATGPVIGAYDQAALITKTSDWWVETAIHVSTSTWPTNAQLEVAAVTTGGGSVGRDCGLTYTSGAWHVNGTTTPYALGSELQVLLHVNAAGTFECVLDGTVVRTGAASGISSWYALLQSTARVEFRWIDIVQ